MLDLSPLHETASSLAHTKIGLLGGSFNPAHDGHLEMSRYALQHLGLDAVWWLVSPQNPLKTKDGMASITSRLASARKLLDSDPAIGATDCENALGTQYTYDTVKALKARFPQTSFVWLMGADNLAQIDDWYQGEELFRLVPIAVFRRNGYDTTAQGRRLATLFREARLSLEEEAQLVERKPPAWLVLNNPHNLLSATRLRNNPTLSQH